MCDNVEQEVILYPEQRRRTPFQNAPFVDEFLIYAGTLGGISAGKLTAEKVLLALIELSEEKNDQRCLVMQGVLDWRKYEKLDFEAIKQELKAHISSSPVTTEEEEYISEILRKSYNTADKENFLWYTFSHILFGILDAPTPKIKEILERNKL